MIDNAVGASHVLQVVREAVVGSVLRRAMERGDQPRLRYQLEIPVMDRCLRCIGPLQSRVSQVHASATAWQRLLGSKGRYGK